MVDMINEIRGAIGNTYYLYLYGGSFIVLLFLLKGKRKFFVIPGVLITTIIMNPAFYNVWNKINDYAYWRTIWMVPIIPFCAAVPALIVEKVSKNWKKAGIIALFAVLFSVAGTYIYLHPSTSFGKAENVEKLPNDVVLIGEALLELDDTPSVVADYDICIYLRQYSGKIRSLYARDIYWGYASELAKDVYSHLSNPDGDLHKVAQIMLNYDYKYLVSSNNDNTRKATLNDAGFELIKQVNDYGIYLVTGIPTEIRKYNEKHQVIELTYIDEKGNPIDNSKGIATFTYKYDKNGKIIEEFHLDASGNPTLDSSGKAGYKRVFNRQRQLVEETWLGKDKEPVEAGGYATRKCEHNRDKRLVGETYYDKYGNPMLRTDMLYAEKRMEYDEKGNVVGERYYGLDGKLTNSSLGYAGINREYDENKNIISEMYLDADSKPIIIDAGYSTVKRCYDENGNTIEECYFDENDNKTMCDRGYACVLREYDDVGNVIHEWYEDQLGKGVMLSGGYAGFTREYDDAGNVIMEKYLNAEGFEAPAGRGYSIVRRVYDTNNRIVRESYYNGETPYILKEGYSGFIRFYNSKGELCEEHYIGIDGELVTTQKGYAVLKHTYDENNRKAEDCFFDTEGNPAIIGAGYTKCQYKYDELGQLSLVYYLDSSNKKVEAGSGFFYDYLKSLENQNVSVFIVAKDEASSAITVTLYEELKKLGIQTDLRGKYRESFYAIITPDKTIEEVSSEKLVCEGTIGSVSYAVMSAGFLVGNSCSIQIDGVEYAKNTRGLNIVVVDNEQNEVIDTIAFDTCTQEMSVTR